jgi:hypothetical protein
LQKPIITREVSDLLNKFRSLAFGISALFGVLKTQAERDPLVGLLASPCVECPMYTMIAHALVTVPRKRGKEHETGTFISKSSSDFRWLG